jgi:hypothetical protein
MEAIEPLALSSLRLGGYELRESPPLESLDPYVTLRGLQLAFPKFHDGSEICEFRGEQALYRVEAPGGLISITKATS